MRSGQILAFAGGVFVSVAAVVAVKIIIALMKEKTQANCALKLLEKLHLTEFSISDLKQWIKENNPDMKKKVCVMTFEAVNKQARKLSRTLSTAIKEAADNNNCLFLATLDVNNDLDCIQTVVYDRLNNDLKQLMTDSNGFLVLEE